MATRSKSNKSGGKSGKDGRPTLTDAAIRKHVDARSYERGVDYFKQGAIYDARFQDSLVQARCVGRSDDYYHVTARIEKGRIVESTCTCPVGAGGHCKHVVALLLTLRHAPKTFVPRCSLETLLADCSREQLIGLIQKLIQRDPDLESWLELALQSVPRPDNKVQPEPYRRQTLNAFESAGYGWEADNEVTEVVDSLGDIGDELLKNKHYEQAAAVYSGVLQGFIEGYESFQDETGNVISAAIDCIKGLGKCFTQLDEKTAARRDALTVLFDVLHFDLNFGGIDLSHDIPPILKKKTTPEERHTVAARIEKAASNATPDSWSNATWGQLFLEVSGGIQNEAALLQHFRKFGLKWDLVEHFLKKKQLDAALQEIQQGSDYDLLQYGDLLIKHQHAELAEKLIRERMANQPAKSNHCWQLSEWLKRYYTTRKRWDEVLEIELVRFRNTPNFPVYQALKAVATRLKCWPELRPQLLQIAQKSPQRVELIRMHLAEDEVAEALDWLKGLPRNPIAFGPAIALEVAKAAEKKLPEAALKLYAAEAEACIQQRGRESYRTACGYLKKVRQLYKQLDREDYWEDYLGGIREKNSSLRALHEELKRAGL